MTKALFAAKSVLWAGLALEGAWLFIAFNLGPSPYPYQLWLLLLFWLLVLGSVIAFSKAPAVAFIAGLIKALGSALVTSPPGGVAHPWLWFVYYHSLDLVIVVAALAVWTLQRKREQVLRAQTGPATNSGREVRP